MPGLSLGAALPEPHEIFIRRYSAATRPWFGVYLCRKQARKWPTSAAPASNWPRLAGACGSLRHPLALRKPA